MSADVHHSRPALVNRTAVERRNKSVVIVITVVRVYGSIVVSLPPLVNNAWLSRPSATANHSDSVQNAIFYRTKILRRATEFSSTLTITGNTNIYLSLSAAVTRCDSTVKIVTGIDAIQCNGTRLNRRAHACHRSIIVFTRTAMLSYIPVSYVLHYKWLLSNNQSIDQSIFITPNGSTNTKTHRMKWKDKNVKIYNIT